MAFPTTSLLDDFNRSDQSPPGPLWAPTYIQNGNSTNLKTLSNQLGSTGSGVNGYINSDYGADQELYFTLATRPSAGNYIGLFTRLRQLGEVTWDGYALIWIAGSSSDDWLVRRYDDGVNTLLTSFVSAAVAPGEKIGMEVNGNTLRVYKTVSGVWQQVGNDVVDTTYANGGKIGLEISDTTTRIDDVSGGTIITQSIPVNTVAPVVSGNAVKGSTLTSTPGVWDNAPSSYSYTWYHVDTSQAIAGATSSTYTLIDADVGHTIGSKVVASNNAGSSVAAASNTTATVHAMPDTFVRVSGAWVAKTKRVRISGNWVEF